MDGDDAGPSGWRAGHPGPRSDAPAPGSSTRLWATEEAALPEVGADIREWNREGR